MRKLHTPEARRRLQALHHLRVIREAEEAAREAERRQRAMDDSAKAAEAALQEFMGSMDPAKTLFPSVPVSGGQLYNIGFAIADTPVPLQQSEHPLEAKQRRVREREEMLEKLYGKHGR